MESEQLLIYMGSAIAIALVVLANHLITGTKTAHIDSPAAAFSRFLLDFPDFAEDFAGDFDREANPSAVLLSANRLTALIGSAPPDHLGLVRVQGDKLVTRLLGPGVIATAELESGGKNEPAIKLRLNDFSLPQVIIPLGSGCGAAEAKAWLDRLNGLARHKGGR